MNADADDLKAADAPHIYTQPEQRVLVLQGGGALGAYQAGVYEAMHEAGLEPDWIVGTSIGAVNGALIAGNRPADRVEQLRAFWRRVTLPAWAGLHPLVADWQAVAGGVPHFFQPNLAAFAGLHAALGRRNAAFYTTAPLRRTLAELTDFTHLPDGPTRLTVSAVNVRRGTMRYFDSREEKLRLEHVMASAALPPAFPAIEVDGEVFWDGGIYSNTPLETVFDDLPRRNSLIFAVNLWHLEGPAPETLWQAISRQKDIAFASRGDHHIEDERNLHHLRRVINELAAYLPSEVREAEPVRELVRWGTRSTMHVVRLFAPRLPGEGHTKDIDFTARGIEARWAAGYEDTRGMLARAPWAEPVDPLEGVHIHTA